MRSKLPSIERRKEESAFSVCPTIEKKRAKLQLNDLAGFPDVTHVCSYFSAGEQAGYVRIKELRQNRRAERLVN